MKAFCPFALAAPIALLTACMAPAASPSRAATAPGHEAVIILSTGHETGGYDRYEIYASDRIVIRHLNPGSAQEQRREDHVPQAYTRAAAFLAAEGPRTLAGAGRIGAPCPGSVDFLRAEPPVGAFREMRLGCPGGAAAFEALYYGIVTATMTD